MHDDEQVVASQEKPVVVVFVMEVDVLPDRPTLLPHVTVLFWTLVLDFIPGEDHIDTNALMAYHGKNVRGKLCVRCSAVQHTP